MTTDSITSGPAPKTVAEAKREISRLRQLAERLAIYRDDQERKMHSGKLTPEELPEWRKLIRFTTACVSKALTKALHLEYRLPENREPVEHAAEWWGNLERLAAEAREAELREGAARRRVGREDGPAPRPVKFWRAEVFNAKSEEMSTRFYAAPLRCNVEGMLRGSAMKPVSITEIDEAEYAKGTEGRAHRRSGKIHSVN